jgi:hypothetical protein
MAAAVPARANRNSLTQRTRRELQATEKNLCCSSSVSQCLCVSHAVAVLVFGPLRLRSTLCSILAKDASTGGADACRRDRT